MELNQKESLSIFIMVVGSLANDNTLDQVFTEEQLETIEELFDGYINSHSPNEVSSVMTSAINKLTQEVFHGADVPTRLEGSD